MVSPSQWVRPLSSLQQNGGGGDKGRSLADRTSKALPRQAMLPLPLPLLLLLLLLSAALLTDASGQAETTQRFNFRGAGLAWKIDVEEALRNELDAQEAIPKLRLAKFESALAPLVQTLPKNRYGKMDHTTVQYALRRFFLDRHGWQLRGLHRLAAEEVADEKEAQEESKRQEQKRQEEQELEKKTKKSQVRGQYKGTTTAAKETGPQSTPSNDEDDRQGGAWVTGFLQSKFEERVGVEGADLHSVAALAASLEDLVRHEFSERMRMVYSAHGTDVAEKLSFTEATDRLMTFFVGFLVAGNFSADSYEDLIEKRARFPTMYKDFDDAKDWFDERVSEELGSEIYSFYGRKYSFAEVDAVATNIGDNYYDFNERDCQNMKTTLASLEGRKPGRARLSTFYNMTRYSHWRFTEKASYLKALGALDDTDPSTPMVIIPNYALAQANCLEASHLYSICCRNACESLMGSLEQELALSAASPSAIIDVVSKLSSDTIQAPRELSQSLQERLLEIADLHKGEVPLHGRLFAQWMHHAFPLECPYPHEDVAPPESAEDWLAASGERSTQASESEMQEQVDKDVCAVGWQGRAECEHEVNDLPWTMQERLVAVDSQEDVFDIEHFDDIDGEADEDSDEGEILRMRRSGGSASASASVAEIQPIAGGSKPSSSSNGGSSSSSLLMNPFAGRISSNGNGHDDAMVTSVASAVAVAPDVAAASPSAIAPTIETQTLGRHPTTILVEEGNVGLLMSTTPPKLSCFIAAQSVCITIILAIVALGSRAKRAALCGAAPYRQQTLSMVLFLLGLSYWAGLWNSALIAGGCFFVLLSLPSQFLQRRRLPLDSLHPIKEV